MRKHLRYLTASFGTACFLMGAPTYALGIGDMKLQSALNQNLKAEIALSLSEGEHFADLKIGLATNAKFNEAGIPWTPFLKDIKFQVVNQNGKTVIKLSSKEALKEPFLDFLIQIQGTKGTWYREFTVLVDPPDVYQAAKEVETQKENIPVFPQHFVSATTNTHRLPVVSKPKPKLKPKPKPKVIAKETSVLKTANPLAKSDEAKVESYTLEANQKILELEKKLSEMQKVIAEKDAQIAALKTAPVVTAPANIVVAPTEKKVESLPADASLQMPTNKPVVEQPMLSDGSKSLPVTAIPSITPPPLVKPAPVITTSPTIKPVNSPKNSTDELYYYIAGGFGTLLLGLLGWLRLKNRNNEETQTTNAQNVNLEKDDVAIDVQNEIEHLEDSIFRIDSDETILDIDDSEFEEQELLKFDTLMDDDVDRHNVDDILYKVDVYCAYGNYEGAILLLNDEFDNQPDADNFALRLLKLYVSQNNKTAFAEFIVKLAKLGKKESSEFWVKVSDIAESFYPEALFFTSLPVEPNEISKFPSSLTELDKATANFFDLPDEFDVDTAIFEDSVEDIISPTEDIKVESNFDLDFSNFELDEKVNIQKPHFASEFDLDFATFEVEKQDDIQQPNFDSEFNLDFATFEVEKEVDIKKPNFASEFDLDFSTFEVEK